MFSVLRNTVIITLAFTSVAAAQTNKVDRVALAKQITKDLVAEDFAAIAVHFNERMRQALPQKRLKGVWKNLGVKWGGYRHMIGVRQKKLDVYNVVFVETQFERSLIDIKIVFDPQDHVGGLFFLHGRANYKTPDYVDEKKLYEVSVEVGQEPWKLKGTFTRPSGTAEVPAVLLVHGSGPNDRDETIGPNKPFKDIAWGLASRGIAVLRYDKRTHQYGTGMAEVLHKLTVKEEVVDDAVSALSLLRARAGINQEQVFVLGHSLGGAMAPRIAKSDEDLAGLIVMAGPTRPLEDLILDQLTYLAKLDGKVSDEEENRLKRVRAGVKLVKSKELSTKTSPFDLPLKLPPAYWLDLRQYDAVATAESLSKPMLFLRGERDYQVKDVDLNAWKNGLSSQKDVTFKTFPALNHLFMSGKGPSMPAEYMIEGHVHVNVIDDVAQWIKSH